MSHVSTKKSRRGTWILTGSVVVLIGLMALGTRVISTADVAAATADGIDPGTYASEHYRDVVVEGITERAVTLAEVAQALAEDPVAAAKKYAIGEGPTATYSVTVTGVAGERAANGQLPLTVEGLPEGTTVAVQTGPALMGTALRDATGEIGFAMFTNQLDFQSVGDKLNQQMKTELLDKTDPAGLPGKTVTVTGAFQPLNPSFLLITPVAIEVAQ
ncbi:putative lipoprotein [Mycetocola sp. BIGb0189]|uniref:DUF2291 domain-containing protein n=1 Tax=Mycetocola sp. BIGb0189 TaxID=2940604 RepID=UPI00216861AA|nr:DUF2291 domain-containing protein [Mycetocola sp. BIGb0189]MCS4276851.1 putative lipoprotein [Mycetocola sp. BIGb0189]